LEMPLLKTRQEKGVGYFSCPDADNGLDKSATHSAELRKDGDPLLNLVAAHPAELPELIPSGHCQRRKVR